MTDALQASTLTHGRTRVGHVQWAAYAAPAFATYFFLNPTWSILPGIYARHYGLNLTDVAAVVFLARIFDAVSDPVIGLASDKHRAAGGSRKLWVLAGGAGLIVAAYFLYAPSGAVTPLYFLGWSVAFFVCWTIAEIPALAWGREIAQAPADRASVFGWRIAFVFSGSALFFLVPFLPSMATDEGYTPALLQVAFTAGAVIMVATLAFNFFYAPAGQATRGGKTPSILRLATSVFLNRPLLNFVAFFGLTNAGIGMWYGFMFLFLSSYLAHDEHIAVIFLVASVCGLVSIPVWLRLIKYVGVRTALVGGYGLFIAVLAASLLLEPGSSWLLALLTICGGFIALGVVNLAIPAILADIADYGTWKFRADPSATYFAVQALVSKATYAIGGALALWIAGTFSFDPSTTMQSPQAATGLRLAYVIVPAAFIIIGTITFFGAPLEKSRMSTIRRRLEANHTRHEAPDASVH